jgi:hypothetical protein
MIPVFFQIRLSRKLQHTPLQTIGYRFEQNAPSKMLYAIFHQFICDISGSSTSSPVERMSCPPPTFHSAPQIEIQDRKRLLPVFHFYVQHPLIPKMKGASSPAGTFLIPCGVKTQNSVRLFQ